MVVRYLYHSGFYVETREHILIFDHYQNAPQGGTLADGVIDPAELAAKGKPVTVLVSHSHGDHYDPLIFAWREQLPHIRYLLSDDVRPPEGEKALSFGPGEERDLGDLQVRTLASTDLGVAWLVQVDGCTIYHAGDLHWWRWEDESDVFNSKMERDYKEQVERLSGTVVDLAFLPLDPRQQQNYRLGMEWFLQRVEPRFVVPMHMGDQLEISQQLQEDPAAASYRDRVAVLHHRGEALALPEFLREV